MSKQLDFTDFISEQMCCYCGLLLEGGPTNKDHVPSRGIFNDPSETDLPVVTCHQECNREHSYNESYFYAFLSSALSGTHKWEKQLLPKAKKILKSDKRLRREIYASYKADRDGRKLWAPSVDKIKPVILKNARGHIYHDLHRITLPDPLFFVFAPLENLSPQYLEFLEGLMLKRDRRLWPGVGSKNLGAVAAAWDHVKPSGRFSIIQDERYQYRISSQNGTVACQSLMHDYLFTCAVFALDTF